MKATAAKMNALIGKGIGREDWIEMQLIHTFMRYARPALHAASVLLVVITATLYNTADPQTLWTWTAAAVAITLYRYRVVAIYQRTLRGVSGPRLHAFLVRYRWTWSLTALIWGSLMFVFFLKTPLYDQFLCMLVLVGMGGFAVGTFSSHIPAFRGYVDGLATSVFACLVWQLFVERGMPGTFNTYSMVFLVAVYWFVIRIAGARFHEVQRSNLELQFDNAALILSLTEKSLAAEEAVETTNRFIASAAHDLRQPVHALDLYATWLAAEPEFVAQIVPKILRSTNAITDLFNSLFDLAGLNSDPLRVKWQDVDLAALVQDLEVQYAPLAAERGLRLRMRSQPTVARTDPVLLRRLIGNLLSNAIRNTRQGGVLLALRRRKGIPYIEVWDTGVGIAHEHQDAIFKEFYRIPQQGTEEGFGLGLAIVSRLSQALGHPVTLASRAGRGSVFSVQLKTDWANLDIAYSD
ncbi:MAG: HAMP domain-containing sensor histidine kinase [Polaromonas sp.]|nr:HAMP domain-containing sensor histidine kinase [Polaromonas sp.]